MSLQRTPPPSAAPRDDAATEYESSEIKLREHYRLWRRNLHKAKDYRVKVLRALAQEGDAEASEMLGEPARAYGAVRCKLCSGCLLMSSEKSCGVCRGCVGGRGCEEHHRRCREWPRNSNTFHDGSVITAISSQFDLMSADLSKYEAVIDLLREIDVEMEEDIDQLSPDSSSRANPRFHVGGRAKELEDERQHYAKLAGLLQRHVEVTARLDEVTEDTNEQAGHSATATKDLTATQTSRELIELFSHAVPPTQEQATPSGLPRADSSGDETAEISDGDHTAVEEQAGTAPGWGPDFQGLEEILPRLPDAALEVRPPAPPYRPPTDVSTRLAVPMPGVRPVPTDPWTTRTRLRAPTPSFRPQASAETTSGPRLSAQVSQPDGATGHQRRRSQSNEFVESNGRQGTVRFAPPALEDKFFERDHWVMTRRMVIANQMQSIQDAVAVGAREAAIPVDWVKEQLGDVQRTLDEAEKVEAGIWLLLVRIRGPEARAARASEWARWHQRVASVMTSVRRSLAGSTLPREVPTPSQPHEAATCQRRGGFLERVKLPAFSGSIEDYGEFSVQFKELCRGENYTDVIELAQLRQKLPREATSLIVGLATPSAAWSRLDETYGNQEMQTLAALKRLRNLKLGKTTPHDRVVELANGVQRCMNVLTALDRKDALLHDRETFSEVVSLLPADSQQRWYHRKGARNETQAEKGRNFLTWLEEERADAVAIHLDFLARRDKPVTSGSSQRAPAASGGTDQSVYAASHATAALPGESQDTVLVTTEGGGGGRSGSDQRPGRIDVTTSAQAKEVAAKRRTNLEAKNLDKCPICKASHEYEKTWATVSPPVKTKMLSTLLTSCPRFLAMTPDQRTVSVTSHAACLLCTSWEHVKHRFGGREVNSDPKCKVMVSGAECAGKHGKWYHLSVSTTGNMVGNSCAAGDRLDVPGLYEVYRADFKSADGTLRQGTIMVDSGSNTDYIRHDFAASLGIVGDRHQCRIKVIDSDYRTVQTAKYQMTIVDRDQEEHDVTALGLESITTLPSDPDLSPLLSILEGVPAEVIDRPQGQVDVLIGLRNSGLHGRDERDWGNLRLLRSKFGCGWAIRGTHEALSYSPTSVKPSYSAELHALRNAVSEVPDGAQVFHVVTSHGHAAEFHELAELGTTPVPACVKCAGCTDCTFRRKRLSREDQEVVSRIEASLKVDEVTG